MENSIYVRRHLPFRRLMRAARFIIHLMALLAGRELVACSWVMVQNGNQYAVCVSMYVPKIAITPIPSHIVRVMTHRDNYLHMMMVHMT